VDVGQIPENSNDSTGHQYESNLARLINFFKHHVQHIMVVSPGLYSPLGEMIEHWEDSTQHSTIKVIRMQERACIQSKVTCINFRKILMDKIREQFRAGVKGKDLTSMVGNKKEWIHQNALAPAITTWDYQGDGGIFTFDGEHMNRRGTKLLLQVIAEQFQKWKGFWSEDIRIQQPSNAAPDAITVPRRKHSVIRFRGEDETTRSLPDRKDLQKVTKTLGEDLRGGEIEIREK
jgi:hypothetical protein